MGKRGETVIASEKQLPEQTGGRDSPFLFQALGASLSKHAAGLSIRGQC